MMENTMLKMRTPSYKKYNVLCVDDEKNVLRALERSLRKEHYNVFTASSGKAGLEILKGLKVQLIVADFRMPEMNGVDFLKKAKSKQPDAIRMLLSGYASIDMVVKAVNQAEIFKILSKPWSEVQLRQEINLALQHWELVQKNRKLNRQIDDQLQKLREMNEQLEVLLDKRTREIIIKNQALELSHQILDNLPIPAFAMATEGFIVYMNKSAGELFRGENVNPIGQKIDAIFSSEIATLVSETISSRKPGALESYSYKNKTFTVRSAIVQDEYAVRGATAIFIEK